MALCERSAAPSALPTLIHLKQHWFANAYKHLNRVLGATHGGTPKPGEQLLSARSLRHWPASRKALFQLPVPCGSVQELQDGEPYAEGNGHPDAPGSWCAASYSNHV
jgi:hypothetical protein